MKHLNLAGWAAIPLAFLVHLWIGKGADGHPKNWEPVATFVLAALGVIPLAQLMGEATEHLAARTGPTWGGLLNATFGNAAELIIAVIALSKGLNEIVKASLTGSILGNLLLVAGAAMLAGGWRRERQRFNQQSAEANSGLLALAVAAMLFPAIFHFSALQMHDATIVKHDHRVSVAVSVILLIVYGLGLLFTLRTHAHIFSRRPAPAAEMEAPAGAVKRSHNVNPQISPAGAVASATATSPGVETHDDAWSVKKSIIMLLVASIGVGVVAELLVGTAERLGQALGWNHVFIGVILLAIIGNAAEHSTALMLAMRDDMDTAMTITYQSSLQIALFATPVLVLTSIAMIAAGWVHPASGTPQYLDLMFSPMEVAAVVLAVATVIVLGLNGETNWFEGVLLLALYAILAIAFFYLPSGHG